MLRSVKLKFYLIFYTVGKVENNSKDSIGSGCVRCGDQFFTFLEHYLPYGECSVRVS